MLSLLAAMRRVWSVVFSLFLGHQALAEQSYPRRVETKRLVLTALEDGDFSCLERIQTSAEAMQFITGKPRTPDGVRAFLERELGHWKTRGFGYYIVRLKEDWTPIAYMGLRAMDPPFEDDFEIGYVARGFARQGYAYEALTELVGGAFTHLGMARVLATVAEPHKASQGLATKLGMTPIGKAFYDGFDCDVLELTRDQWAQRK